MNLPRHIFLTLPVLMAAGRGGTQSIPGRTTRLTLAPTRTGTFRGECAEYCAEYCGEAHAHMNFAVVVMDDRNSMHGWNVSDIGVNAG